MQRRSEKRRDHALAERAAAAAEREEEESRLKMLTDETEEIVQATPVL